MSQVTITIAGKDRPRLVLEQIGDDTITGGVGGWVVIERPDRSPITRWENTPGVTWTIPLSLDGFGATERSVENQIDTLKSWGAPSDKTDTPPTLTVAATVGRGDSTSRWVLQDIEWGDQVRNIDGDRIRQDLVATFLEYEAGQIRKGPGAKSRDNGKKHKWVPIGPKDQRCKQCKRERDHKIHSNR